MKRSTWVLLVILNALVVALIGWRMLAATRGGAKPAGADALAVNRPHDAPQDWRANTQAGEPPIGGWRMSGERVEVWLPSLADGGSVGPPQWYEYIASSELHSERVSGVVLLEKRYNTAAAAYIVTASGKAAPVFNLVTPTGGITLASR